MEATYLLVGHDEHDLVRFRDAVEDLGASAVWDVSRALELLVDRALTGIVVAGEADGAERLIELARQVQPDLPVVRLAELATPRPEACVRKRADVLLVDADRRFVRRIDDALRAEGYAAAATTSSREARSLVRTTRFQLLILDVAHVELARALRRGDLGVANQHASIVFLTHGDYSAAYEETFELNAFRCVVKPATGAQICKVVAGALHEVAA